MAAPLNCPGVVSRFLVGLMVGSAAVVLPPSIRTAESTDPPGAVAGFSGGLVVVSIEDGRQLNQRDLPPPLWDGMAVAEGTNRASAARTTDY